MDFSRVWQDHGPRFEPSSAGGLEQYLNMSLDTGLYFNDQNFNLHTSQAMHGMVQEKSHHTDDAANNVPRGQIKTNPEHLVADPTSKAMCEFNGKLLSVAPKHSLYEGLPEEDTQIQLVRHQSYNNQRERRHTREHSENFYSSSSAIPPTPNSIEIRSGNNHFYGLTENQQQTPYDKLHQNIEDQEIIFSPLVSPAVTPHDFRFKSLDYSTSGIYFSPLSSPALQAQDENSPVHDLRNIWLTKSLTDSHSSSVNSATPSRQSNNVQSQPQSLFRSDPSPTLNPEHPEQSLHTSKILENGIEILTPKISKYEVNAIIPPSHSEETENYSVSSHGVSNMPPPPLPSPALVGSSPHFKNPTFNDLSKRSSFGCPATPASLMKIQSPMEMHDFNSDVREPRINDMYFLEAAQPKGSFVLQNDIESKQQAILNARTVENAQISGFQPPSPPFLPHLKTAASVNQSPPSDCLDSTIKSYKSRAPIRISKRRANTLRLLSPVLLPRISPSILPSLLNGGKAEQETASMFLAAKSNYQNMLEGTHIPGAYYSPELSSNLTSKRTSHKIAEQGRRNRMNSALQELSRLLPRGQDKDSGCDKNRNGDAEDGEIFACSKGTSQNANSKASTVEQAILYIIYLKAQLDKANKDSNKKLENSDQESQS